MESKVNNLIKEYYTTHTRISLLNDKLVRVSRRIKELRRDIAECNVDLDYDIKGIDYSVEKISGGETSSTVERIVEKALNKLIRELEQAIREKYKLMYEIRQIQKNRDNIGPILDKLAVEEKQVLDARYGSKRGQVISYDKLEAKLTMSKTTIHTIHQNAIEFIEEQL